MEPRLGNISLDHFRKGDRRARAAVIGAGVVAGGLGLTWLVRRALPRLHIAPGWPGAKAHWSPAGKHGVGAAIGAGDASSSLVWFTIGRGAVNEVFYPWMDLPRTRDLALIVTDGRRFVSDERLDADHQVDYLADGVPAYRLTNTCKRGRYRIEKTIIAHPDQSAVLQRIKFTALKGSPEDYHLYAVLDPLLGLRKGLGGTAWIHQHKGRFMPLVFRDDTALALACSLDWVGCSVGYVDRVSDGRRDVLRHGRMTRHYERAPRGNVILTGEVDPSDSGGEFVLSLGFGADPEGAAHRALTGVRDDFDELVQRYVRNWRNWQRTLLPLEEVEPGERDLYRKSAMVLRAQEGKLTRGAIVASLSIPWGEAFADKPRGYGQGGYHMVWPRDLVQIASGLLAAGAKQEARRALDFLRDSQEADGHWPQNMWTSGETFWSAVQLGETAQPPLLLDLLHREGALDDDQRAAYWPMVKRAAAYLVRQGPSSQEDRWENERGFNAYTISVLIAALLVAAEMAEAHGETREAEYLRETADLWYSNIDYWTYVTNFSLAKRFGVSGYYLRIAPPGDHGQPVKHDEHLKFWYLKPRTREKLPPAAIVSSDTLAYVRFGLRAPDDPRIVDTLKVIDGVTKVETPCGPAWHRYTHDGYGEKADGSPFDGKHGHGRAWPLLAGERAHYELAAGRRDEAVRLLRAMENFAGEGGLIPEQVWDTYDIPEHGLYFGRPSGSAMPLAWAHAEYIKLRRSLRDGRVFDLPPQTVQRYLVEKVESPREAWRIDRPRWSIPASKILRVELLAPAVIHWRAESFPTRDTSLGIHYTDLPTESLAPGETVRFTIAWTEPWRQRRQIQYELVPSVVRIGRAEHDQDNEGGRSPIAAGAGMAGAARTR